MKNNHLKSIPSHDAPKIDYSWPMILCAVILACAYLLEGHLDRQLTKAVFGAYFSHLFGG